MVRIRETQQIKRSLQYQSNRYLSNRTSIDLSMFARIARNTIAKAAQHPHRQTHPSNANITTRAASQKEAISNATTTSNHINHEILAKARKISPPIGLVAGLFGSLVGVGGGVVIVPSIVSRCKNIPQKLVSGTSLAAVLSTAVASALTFGSSGCVDLTAAAIISPFAMLTAPFGARLTAKLNCVTLRRILGYFLFYVAPIVPLKAYLLAGKEQDSEQKDAHGNEVDAKQLAAAGVETTTTATTTLSAVQLTTALHPSPQTSSLPLPSPLPLSSLPSLSSFLEQHYRNIKIGILEMPTSTRILLAATGSIAGLASGLLGIGGGTIVTPLLALVLPPGNQAMVLGTSLFSMVPPSAAALIQHARMGNVDWRMAAGLAVGTAVGGGLGSSVAVETPSGVLEAIFAIGMVFLGRKTLQTAK